MLSIHDAATAAAAATATALVTPLCTEFSSIEVAKFASI